MSLIWYNTFIMTLKFDPYAFEKTEINGVPVLYKKIESAPCIHFRFVFKYGAFDDPVGKEGVAHFLEHMLFKGTDIFADEKEVELFRKRHTLNSLNANTSYYELKIVGKCLPEKFDKVLEGIFSMILSPKITEKDFNDEKRVIIQESWQKFFNDKHISYIKKYINNNDSIPNRNRIYSALGWPETIEKITHKDIWDAYNKYFVRENLSIFLAGNIQESDISKLNFYINKLKSGQRNNPVYVPDIILDNKVNIMENKREDIGLTDKKQTFISIERVLPRIKIKEEEKIFLRTAVVMRRILNDLLFERLRIDNNWCYGAGADISTNPDRIFLNFESELDPNHKDEAKKIIYELIEDLKTDKYLYKFDDIKNMVIDATISAERLTGDILDSVVSDIKIFDQIVTLDEFIENIKLVTFEDIKSFAQKYFVREKMFEEIFLPNI